MRTLGSSVLRIQGPVFASCSAFTLWGTGAGTNDRPAMLSHYYSPTLRRVCTLHCNPVDRSTRECCDRSESKGSLSNPK